jgi:hypothetical protein
MDNQLKQLIELQTEQNQLLKKHLWRFRFSLMTLLLLTTVICCCLGFLIYLNLRPLGQRPRVLPVAVNPTNDRYAAPAKAIPASATSANAIPTTQQFFDPVAPRFPTSQATGNNNAVVQ